MPTGPGKAEVEVRVLCLINREWAVGDVGGEFQAESPEGRNVSELDTQSAPGATQHQRSRGISSFRDCGEEVPPASAELRGEAGWERVSETRRSGWGLLLPSPWQPNSGTNIAQLCSEREKVGRLSGDEPWLLPHPAPSPIAEAPCLPMPFLPSFPDNKTPSFCLGSWAPR